MTLTGVKTRPLLRGTLTSAGPWGGMFAQSGYRVYPYQLGCTVRASGSSVDVLTNGLGDFAANNYVMACAEESYGDSWLFIPDTNRISRVSSVSGSDDALTLTNALVLSAGEFLLNLGNDTASAPLVQPNYDGSTITLYTDNAGVTSNPANYVLTGSQGMFYTWITAGKTVVDLLVCDSSGVPRLVLPFYSVGHAV